LQIPRRKPILQGLGRVPKWSKGTDCKSDLQEPPDSTKLGNSDEVDGALGAKLTALVAGSAELRMLVQSWSALPDALRAGIIAMVRAANGEYNA
jgi:hypothetical protein